MKEKTNMDARLESALQQDASGVTKLASEIPESLRSRIARTPSVPVTSAGASSTAATTAAKFFTTKFMLAAIGGMLGVAAVYFSLRATDSPLPEGQPGLSTPPVTVFEIDTPRQVDTLSGKVIRSTPSRGVVQGKQPRPSQGDVDKLLGNMPEPESTLRTTDSIRVKGKRGR